MATKTPRLGLNKPGYGEPGWDQHLNSALDVLDAYVGQLLDERAVSGTATGGSATTLDDTTASWDPGAWAGAIVVVRRGGAVIRVAQISSNTATQLTLAASGTAIQAGDNYTIMAQANAIPLSEKGQPSGVATLDAAGKVVERLSYEGAAGGVATLDAAGELAQPVRIAQMPDAGRPNGLATLDASGKVIERLAYEGIANGVATLDASGLLTAAQLGASYLGPTTGYQKFPNGLIIQFGWQQGGAYGITVTYPIAFPNVVLATVATIQTDGSFAGRIVDIQHIDNASFKAYQMIYNGSTSTAAFWWIAIGY